MTPWKMKRLEEKLERIKLHREYTKISTKNKVEKQPGLEMIAEL